MEERTRRAPEDAPGSGHGAPCADVPERTLREPEPGAQRILARPAGEARDEARAVRGLDGAGELGSHAAMESTPLTLAMEAALADFRADFAQAGEHVLPALFTEPEWSHAEAVRRLDAWSRGEELDGFVRNTTSFLVDDGRILGVSNFRHELTDRLRRHGGHVGYSVRPSARRRGVATELLRRAKEFGRGLGIERLLVTCEPGNTGSVRAIERNGGVLEEEFFHEEEGCRIRTYWIEL